MDRSTEQNKETKQNYIWRITAYNNDGIQVYAPTSNAEEAEVEQFYEDLQDLL